jgi:hypothetical protein
MKAGGHHGKDIAKYCHTGPVSEAIITRFVDHFQNWHHDERERPGMSSSRFERDLDGQ